MKTFEITFKDRPESNIYSANLVIAENEEQAITYFSTLGKDEIVGCTEYFSAPKPGQPIHEVPENWSIDIEEYIEKYVKEKTEKIKTANSRETLLYNYYGASDVLSFLWYYNFITREKMKMYDQILDKEYDEFNKKAKKELENAHKKIF